MSRSSKCRLERLERACLAALNAKATEFPGLEIWVTPAHDVLIGPVSTTYFDGRPRVQHMDQAIVDRLVAEAMEKQ